MDPRINSPEKLTPPDPLPYVSRRSLARVKDVVPIPTECPACRGTVELVNNARIYGGRSYGGWPYAYICSPCDRYVGLHPHTDLPLGTLADKETRESRKRNKRDFFVLLKRSKMSRARLYQHLADVMGIPVEECHWGLFTAYQAQVAGDHCRDSIHLMELFNAHNQSR